MAFGFKSINDSGQLIISDEFQTLHFAGKAVVASHDNGSLTSFPNYSGSRNVLDGRLLITYNITTPGIPTVFIKPKDYNRWACVVEQNQVGNVWTFVVLMSGASTANIPDLYCFVDANAITVPSETHGMIVYRDDLRNKTDCNAAGGFWGGESLDTRDDNTCYASPVNADTTVLKIKTFDSRVRPLSVVDGGETKPRYYPANDGRPRVNDKLRYWNYNSLDFDFQSNDNWTTNSLTTNVDLTKLMYSAPSLAQAVWKRQVQGYKLSGSQPHHSTATWWVMYRNAFRLQTKTVGGVDIRRFQSGWGTYAAGSNFSSVWEDGGWFGGGGGTITTGSQPYEPKTINFKSNTFIIADSTGYL